MKTDLLVTKHYERNGPVFRIITTKINEENGELGAVRDVFEADNTRGQAKKFLGTCADGLITRAPEFYGEIVLNKAHANVDFGRAKKWSTKIAKIIDSLGIDYGPFKDFSHKD